MSDVPIDDPNAPAGWRTMKDGSRVVITRAEALEIHADLEKRLAERAERLPDERSAICAMFDAYDRLRELGWREAIYCPKDGSSFEVIEAGSTGIFRAHYEGEWPKGSWWLEDGGDVWPSRPILHRLYPEDEAKRKAAMEAARERYRAECESAGESV